MPPAPGLFSMITGRPSFLESASAASRASESGTEPAAPPTINLMIRSGQAAPLGRGEIRMPAQAASEPTRAVRRVRSLRIEASCLSDRTIYHTQPEQRPRTELDCFRFANNNCAFAVTQKPLGIHGQAARDQVLLQRCGGEIV